MSKASTSVKLARDLLLSADEELSAKIPKFEGPTCDIGKKRQRRRMGLRQDTNGLGRYVDARP